jgi:hypothetical protein
MNSPNASLKSSTAAASALRYSGFFVASTGAPSASALVTCRRCGQAAEGQMAAPSGPRRVDGQRPPLFPDAEAAAVRRGFHPEEELPFRLSRAGTPSGTTEDRRDR